ncbi:retrovirus-related pol polyprotein from transposon TNT 1-94 [Tanacetum coccineum]
MINQRAVNVAGARENVGTQVVQKSGIQCYNCKEYGHVLRECQKPKRAKNAAYHKEKMLLCKQEEAGVQFEEVTQMQVFANDKEHPRSPECVNDTYMEAHGDTKPKITIDSWIMWVILEKRLTRMMLL